MQNKITILSVLLGCSTFLVTGCAIPMALWGKAFGYPLNDFPAYAPEGFLFLMAFLIIGVILMVASLVGLGICFFWKEKKK